MVRVLPDCGRLKRPYISATGFAPAGALREYRVDTTDIRLLMDSDDLPVQRFEGVEAFEAVRALYKDFIAQRTGYLHRSKSLWLNNVFAPPVEDGPVYVALVGSVSAPTGYVVYTLRAQRVQHRARAQEIRIRDLAWLDRSAYAALWQYLARHDLVGRVVWSTAPMDDPAPDLFIEPRLLHAQDLEGTWWRLVDVPAALAQRGYDTEGVLVLGLQHHINRLHHGLVVLALHRSNAAIGGADLCEHQRALSNVKDLTATGPWGARISDRPLHEPTHRL